MDTIRKKRELIITDRDEEILDRIEAECIRMEAFVNNDRFSPTLAANTIYDILDIIRAMGWETTDAEREADRLCLSYTETWR